MKKCKNYVILILMMVIGFIFGFFLPNKIDINFEEYKFVFENTQGFLITFLEIFFNNIIFCLLLMFGIGIITIPLVLWQGFQLGVLLNVWLATGNSTKQYILLLMPHGIFEFTGLFIFSAIGLNLFGLIRKNLKGINTNFLDWIKKQYKIILIGVLLIFIAAIIETFITPYIFKNFG